VSTPAMDILHETASPFLKGIRVIKSADCAIVPSRKAQALHRIEQMASEVGRMQKLLDELRADVLHLTIE
jgi:hypothetical protein